MLLEDMQSESHPAAGGTIKIKAKGKRRTMVLQKLLGTQLNDEAN